MADLRTNFVNVGSDPRAVDADWLNQAAGTINGHVVAVAQLTDRITALEEGGGTGDYAPADHFHGSEGGSFNPNDFATSAQGAKADTALQPGDAPTITTLIGFWDGPSASYKDAAGANITSVATGVPLILCGGTATQRDAQGWLPASGWAHFPEVLTP